MKKAIFILLLIISFLALGYVKGRDVSTTPLNLKNLLPHKKSETTVKIPRTLVGIDGDKDGIDDLDDIVKGARAEADRQPRYVNAYYQGGYPPETEGVCTDVIWRAFKDAGYNLKEMVDKDIRNNIRAYPPCVRIVVIGLRKKYSELIGSEEDNHGKI